MGLFASIVAVEREKFERFLGLLPESEGQHMALTVLHVRYMLDSGFTFGFREFLGAPRVVDGHGVDAHHQHCVEDTGITRVHNPYCVRVIPYWQYGCTRVIPYWQYGLCTRVIPYWCT